MDNQHLTATIPFVTFLAKEDKDYYYREYLAWLALYPEIGRKYKLNSVKLHQARLGPQTFCWRGWQKYYVWDIGTVRLFVANGTGVAMEIKQGTSLSTAWKHFLAYKKKMTRTSAGRKKKSK